MPSTPETELATDREPLDLVAEEFARRRRDGEHPSIAVYAARHPAVAGGTTRMPPAPALRARRAAPPPAAGRCLPRAQQADRDAARPGVDAPVGPERVGRRGGAGPGAARREPDRPRARPGRDGDRVRGRAGAARQAG